MPCMGLGSGLLKLGNEVTRQDITDSAVIKPSGLRVRCPECDREITGHFSWCPGCGARVKPSPCSYCGGWVAIGSDACPRCGAPGY